MSITGELRSWAEGNALRAGMSLRTARDQALAIADRIDAEYQKAIRELNNLADASLLLPVDADGVPIRVGDKVYRVEGGWVYTVKSITFYLGNTTVSFECKHGFGSESAHNVRHYRHYHAPTVEDVLREFALKVAGEECMTMRTGVVEEYASKLRLVNDEE